MIYEVDGLTSICDDTQPVFHEDDTQGELNPDGNDNAAEATTDINHSSAAPEVLEDCARIPSETNSGDEEESADCLPESEIREIAMYQWHLQQVEGARMESNHQQPRLESAEPVDEFPTSSDHNHTNSETVPRTWQQLMTGQRESRALMLTHETTRANDYWGDMCLDKMGGHIRIYVQNVNGIRLDKRGGQFDSVCQVQKEVQADIFLGQEHNLDSSQYSVRSILHSTYRQHWQRARLNIATTPIAFKNTYKPGGTFMLTVGNSTGRIKSQDQDKWGRWVSQTLQGSAGRQVTIVSAYQPVTDASKPGTVTVATQQHTLLVQQGDSILSPREAFCRDLRAFLLQRRETGDELILVGDFNEDIGTPTPSRPADGESHAHQTRWTINSCYIFER